MKIYSSSMMLILVVVLLIFSLGCCVSSKASCPCDNPAWCEPISQFYQHELFIFSVSDDNWPHYDWSKITTVVQFNGRNDDMMCYAHSQGVRVVSCGSIATANLTSPTARSEWVAAKVQDIQERHLDGFNLDFESEITKDNQTLRDGLTALVKELRTALNAILENPQVTVDVAWSAKCIDSRCFDYEGLAVHSDFLLVMSYDERSQIFYDCAAWANSAVNNTLTGVQTYMELGIPANQLVLAVPWYGYNYPCLSLDQKNVCWIAKVPFRGVPCSDAAGSQWPYKNIVTQLLNRSTSGLLWDKDAQSPYFNYKDDDGMHQVWYDNPQSLKIKYDYAIKTNLRGVGMWNADELDYSNSTEGHKQQAEMWGALPNYRIHHN